jgi:serine/threonine-protein kinase
MSTRNDETKLDAEVRTEAPRPALAAGVSPAAGGDSNLGRRIGPYRVERLIARGGMGRVYLALREDDYEQRVALKLVDRRPEKLDVLDRFFRERQILARLQHPNIARILDGGTTDDALPFLVMEYVEGEPVDRYCDLHRLGLRRRLRLFQHICQAMHFAHQNLVVHRDLKPGNILVTPDGAPKLLDFGIAKIVGGAPGATETRPGKIPLTPGYASPEQLLGEPVTTASDVYSLGVLLYRLVSGRGPYEPDGGGWRRTVELICEVEPPPPSTVARRGLRRRLAGDVDAIVSKAMSKKPEQRYVSASQLAADVGRHLADLPVDAGPGPWGQRARKGIRRHKVGLAVLILVLGFAATTTVLWRRAVHKGRLAEQARVQALASQAAAEKSLRRAERVSGFLEDLFRSADPDAGALTVREVLDRGRRQLTVALEDEPEIRAELLATLGTVYNNLSLYREARELKEEALANRLAADPADRADLAADLNNLGRLLYDLGDYTAAESRFRDALAMWQRLGDEHGSVVGLRNLAAALTQSGRSAEALELYGQIIDIQRRLFGAGDVEVGKSLYSLGMLHRTRGDPEAAEPLLRQAREIFVHTLGPRHTRVAAVTSSLGRVLHDQGRNDEARRSFEEALELRLELLGEDHVQVANSRKNLAALLLEEGETEAAGELLEKALATLRRKKPAGDWTIADAESIWGSFLVAGGRYAAAEPLLLAAYRTIRSAKGDDNVATADARRRVLALYQAWGQEEKAAAFAQGG